MPALVSNRTNVERIYAEIWSRGSVALIDELFAPSLAFEDPDDADLTGREGFKALVRQWRAGLPDMREEVLDLVVEGDRAMCRFRLTGTQTGPFLGHPPSGRKVDIKGVDLYHFENGLITSFGYLEDTLGLLRQLGVMPA